MKQRKIKGEKPTGKHTKNKTKPPVLFLGALSLSLLWLALISIFTTRDKTAKQGIRLGVLGILGGLYTTVVTLAPISKQVSFYNLLILR